MTLVLVCQLLGRVVAAQGKDVDGVINLNTAGAETLELLPGIGPAKVRSIVAYRQRHPFRTIDELVRIKGIGRKMVRRLRPHLAVSGPTTARALRRPPDSGATATAPTPTPTPTPTRKSPARLPMVGSPPRLAVKAAINATSPLGPHTRPRPPPTAGERGRRSRANHCPRPP